MRYDSRLMLLYRLHARDAAIIVSLITLVLAHAGALSVDAAMQPPIEKNTSLLFIIIFLNFSILSKITSAA